MSQDILIGIDAGTSVIKSVAFSSSGEQIAIASRANSYRTLSNGGVEQDMRRTWDDTAATLRELGELIPDLATRVAAIAVTGQGDGTWLIDAEGEPVHDGWLWLDARAADEAREIAASDTHNTIYHYTGTGVNVCQTRTHWYWMKRHAPELLKRATTSMHCKDWLYFCLSGERATDPSEGVFTFGDFRSRNYCDEVLAALELSDLARLLPPIVDGEKQGARLSAQAAAQTGLPQGLPLALGYVDVACTALGGGLYDAVLNPGISIIGSTGMHMRFVADADNVQLNEDETGYTMVFPGDSYAQMQSNMAATLNIDWCLDIALEILQSEGLSRSRGDLLKQMDDKVLQAPAGAALYHPYISSAGERGPFIEPAARASFTGLAQDSGYFALMRSVYEGLALSARDCYDAMGVMPADIRLSGGAARSSALRSILAAALNAPIRGINREEAGAAGAAMISAVQLGLYADMSACVAEWVTPHLTEPENPDPQLAAYYSDLFDLYQATRNALAPTWLDYAQLRKKYSS